MEVQLRTKEMDDFAEIGRANHENYEQLQAESGSAPVIEKGKCVYYDEAYERLNALQNLDLAKVDVNLFGAVNNMLINDGCGFFRGRLILPYEHLSRFQNDLID
jgi:(p)ppGpp synthase/HD superfamily hydrolase